MQPLINVYHIIRDQLRTAAKRLKEGRPGGVGHLTTLCLYKKHKSSALKLFLRTQISLGIRLMMTNLCFKGQMRSWHHSLWESLPFSFSAKRAASCSEKCIMGGGDGGLSRSSWIFRRCRSSRASNLCLHSHSYKSSLA